MIDINKYANGEELFDGQYKLLRQLSSEGGTADVWLAIAVKTIDTLGEYSEDEDQASPQEDSGMKVAIKIYKLQNILDLEGEQRFKDEFKIVYNCHHTNLLPPSHFSIFEDAPYLVMPYCQEGSSEKLIGREKDPKVLWKYMSDVASGLAYLHSCNPPIIHQDIKPANVLIDSNGNFAITDFGISAKMDNGTKNCYDDANSGTLVYMAPERFLENAIPQPESDIWALGATLYEIVTGDVPFGNNGGKAQLEGQVTPAIKENIPKDLKRLIYSCLDKDPKKRPGAKGIAEFIINKRLKKKWTRSIIASIVGLLIASSIFVKFGTNRIDPFEEFCNSGDSIISSVKIAVKNDDFEVNDVTKSKLDQAAAFYQKALTQKDGNTSQSKLVNKRLQGLSGIIDQCIRYREVSDTISMTEDLEMPEQNAIYKKKRNEIYNQIIQDITEL